MTGVRTVVERRHAWLALALYVIGAVVIQRHAVAHLTTTISGNGVGDPTQYMWAMWWWPHAILTGANPFVTHEIWYPAAYNLGSVTSSPLPAIVMSPVTLIAGRVDGPIVSYNLAQLAAPVINGFAAYRLALYVTSAMRGPGAPPAPLAAVLAGWLYGLGGYGIGPLQGHLHLVYTFAGPVLLLLAAKLYRGDVGPARVVVLGGLTIAAQLLCGTEIIFTGTMLALIAFLLALLIAPDARRGRLLVLILPLIGAYVLGALITSPFLYYALSGPSVQAGQASLYPADALSFFIPGPAIWLGGARFADVSMQYSANSSEQVTYLGLPLIAMTIGLWVADFRRPAVRLLCLTTLAAVIWSLGVALTIDGAQTVSLPFHLVAGRRLFNEILPIRVGVWTALGAALASAVWLSRPVLEDRSRDGAPLRTGRWRQLRAWSTGASGVVARRWLLALLAVVFLFPNSNAGDDAMFKETYTTPAFFTSGAYRHVLPHDAVVLPIPFGPDGPSLLWQAQSRGWFRLASGWFGYYPPSYATSPVVGQLLSFHSFTDPVRKTGAFLRSHRVDFVLVADGAGGPWTRLLTQLGLHARSIGGVQLYRVSIGEL